MPTDCNERDVVVTNVIALINLLGVAELRRVKIAMEWPSATAYP